MESGKQGMQQQQLVIPALPALFCLVTTPRIAKANWLVTMQNVTQIVLCHTSICCQILHSDGMEQGQYPKCSQVFDLSGEVACHKWMHIFRVKDHCIQRGLSWALSLAKAASTEGEYYEDLLTYYRQNYRVLLSALCTQY